MNYIGSVIQEYRKMLKMSRRDLSTNICSEKYIYLIERGERTPSAEMTRLIGDKLGIDLFKYYEYLDCENPIRVEAIMKLFDRYRAQNNMNALKEITDEAMELADFNKIPWVYEIKLNNNTYMILKESRYKEAVESINNLLENMESKYFKSICVANFNILLSTSYIMLMDYNHAKETSLAAYEIVSSKQKNEKYAQVVITVKINKITIHFLLGELDEVIKEANLLDQYQTEMASYERSHFTFFYLAFAYYKMGLEEKGISCFLKGLYVSLTKYRPTDIFLLSSYEVFIEILDDPRVPSVLVDQFKKEYEKN